eukprot:43400-Eustigmatos_ZCMA.PRE.1
MLLEHGGCDVVHADHTGQMACHHACIGGHGRGLRQWLDAGADPTVRDAGGRTHLELAADAGYEYCLMILQ